MASVKLNGTDLGITWTPPFRVEVTDAIRTGPNRLEITLVNSWQNRLIGDRDKKQEEHYTRTNIRIREDWELRNAGLLGPVEVLGETGR